MCVCEHSDRKQLLSYYVLSLLLIIYNITAFIVSWIKYMQHWWAEEFIIFRYVYWRKMWIVLVLYLFKHHVLVYILYSTIPFFGGLGVGLITFF